jgi:hypothetical protein
MLVEVLDVLDPVISMESMPSISSSTSSKIEERKYPAMRRYRFAATSRSFRKMWLRRPKRELKR